jgi:hypothetical protein
METYTKQKVLEQLTELEAALADFRSLKPSEPKSMLVVGLMEAGVAEVRLAVAREWT